jgi:hypothetical protein
MFQFCPFTSFLRRSPKKVTGIVGEFFGEVFQPLTNGRGEEIAGRFIAGAY